MVRGVSSNGEIDSARKDSLDDAYEAFKVLKSNWVRLTMRDITDDIAHDAWSKELPE